MLQLRYYQEEAGGAIFDYWGEKPGNPLVVMATGTGKSLVMADLIRSLIEGWPDMRIICATHVKELIEQSFLELLGVWSDAPAGIFSAGLRRRDAHKQIVFAGIQTVHNKTEMLGPRDVLIIDEAHLVPPKSETMYGRFIADLREQNPDMKIVGLTATDYRLDSGRLTDGESPMFDDVVYKYDIADGIADGYLAPLSSKPTETGFDLSGVGKSGGDYKAGALQVAVDKASVTNAAVDEIISKGQGRRSWLAFCSGVDHAIHVRDAIRDRGYSCEVVTGETPEGERREILRAFKNYELRAVSNNSVLTTGFNHKGVDLIAALRPTLSKSLYVQMGGRGTRALYADGMPQETADERRAAIASGPKPNCLFLDFAKLVSTHGPIDRVEPKEPGKGEGEAPVKICPTDIPDKNGQYGCEEICHASVKECPACGYRFEPKDEAKFVATAHDVPILSKSEKQWSSVKSRKFRRHEPKIEGNPPTVKATFMCGMTAVNHWLCPQHLEHPNERSRQFPKTKADRFWKHHGGEMPAPQTVDEWLDRKGELFETLEIQLDWGKSNKYPEVKDYRADSEGRGEYDDPEPDPSSYTHGDYLEDEIPF